MLIIILSSMSMSSDGLVLVPAPVPTGLILTTASPGPTYPSETTYPGATLFPNDVSTLILAPAIPLVVS